MNKSYKIKNNDETVLMFVKFFLSQTHSFFFNYRSIPDYWKSVLETIISVSEKNLVSSASILESCDFFALIKEQKNASYQKVN